MFEITEKEATGEVAEIYQDIRETMNMPFPQTIWRNLATKEGALQWVWYSLKPIYQSLHNQNFLLPLQVSKL